MSTAGKSYEAWKESLKQAEAAGNEDWSEEYAAEATGTYWFAGLAPESKGPIAGVLLGVGLLMASAVVLFPNARAVRFYV